MADRPAPKLRIRSMARRSTRSSPASVDRKTVKLTAMRHHHHLRRNAHAEPEQDQRRIGDHGHRVDRGRGRQDDAAERRHMVISDRKRRCRWAAERHSRASASTRCSARPPPAASRLRQMPARMSLIGGKHVGRQMQSARGAFPGTRSAGPRRGCPAARQAEERRGASRSLLGAPEHQPRVRPRPRRRRSRCRAAPRPAARPRCDHVLGEHRLQQQYAEAGGVAEPFADDRADEAERRGEPQRDEDLRQRGGKLQAQQQLAVRRRRSCASAPPACGSTVSRPSSVLTVTGKNVR